MQPTNKTPVAQVHPTTISTYILHPTIYYIWSTQSYIILNCLHLLLQLLPLYNSNKTINLFSR